MWLAASNLNHSSQQNLQLFFPSELREAYNERPLRRKLMFASRHGFGDGLFAVAHPALLFFSTLGVLFDV